jgi:LuxR family maltose regulon positive regulatory protein
MAECLQLLKNAERAEHTASNAAPFDSMVLRTTIAEAYLALGKHGLARTYAERALGNLSAMTEGGLVTTRLDNVIRRINKADADSTRRTEPTGSLLSPREVQILSLFTTGETLADIGRRLYISRNTVKTHTTRIYRKLGVSDRHQAVAAARRLSLL